MAHDTSKPIQHPPGFRIRRGFNWFFLGLTYASYYFCRYNLGIVAPELKATLGFSNEQYGSIQSARNIAYGVGQFVNGLFTDRIGGKQAMTIGAIGTIVLNLAFGWVAWSKIVWIFPILMIIRLMDGYMQAFGAPGFIKINTAWFYRQERGAFAGVFGIMINLGRTAAGQMGRVVVTGISIPLIFFTLTVENPDWRYIFIVPPIVLAVVIVLMNLIVKNHPEEAGYRMRHEDEAEGEDPHAHYGMSFVLKKIASNPVVWIVAGAYFCTGFVRAAIADWWTVYFDESWGVGKDTRLYWWMGVVLFPCLASASSLMSGVISDKFFGGRRAPVAATLYFVQVVFIVLSMLLAEQIVPAALAVVVISIFGIDSGCNATHSILGSAAAMDVGGRKMAGFASGVIDSFQYFGATIAGFGLGRLLDKTAITVKGSEEKLMNPTVWFASMLPFAMLGTVLMVYVWWRHGKSGRAGT